MIFALFSGNTSFMSESDRNIFPVSLPFFPSFVAAGLPSEFDEVIEKGLDLRGLLIERPAATFLVRAGSNVLAWAGIRTNDILVVDRSLEPRRGSIIVAFVRGRFLVRKLVKDPQFPDKIWGVVTSSVRLFPGCPNITLL